MTEPARFDTIRPARPLMRRWTESGREPSLAVMRRLGLTEAGRFDHPRIPEGHPLQPHVTYHLAWPPAS